MPAMHYLRGHSQNMRVNVRKLGTYEALRFEFESAVRFNSKGVGRFENFQIESAMPAPLLIVSLVKRLKPLTSCTVYRLAIAQ